MKREDARMLMESMVSNKNLRKHILAVEALMRFLARELGEDEEKWGLTGLLHDIDYDLTKDNPAQHGLISAQLLHEKGVSADIIHAVKAHADKAPRQSNMDKAIHAADPVTGFIVACALIHPEKKLAPIDTQFVLNRMKEKRFAANVDREAIRSCVSLGLSLERFIQISLDAMKSISSDLGI